MGTDRDDDPKVGNVEGVRKGLEPSRWVSCSTSMGSPAKGITTMVTAGRVTGGVDICERTGIGMAAWENLCYRETSRRGDGIHI